MTSRRGSSGGRLRRFFFSGASVSAACASAFAASGSGRAGSRREPWYDADHELRRANHKGCNKWRGEHIFIGEALARETIGITEIEKGGHLVSFCNRDLGLIGRDVRFHSFAPPRRVVFRRIGEQLGGRLIAEAFEPGSIIVCSEVEEEGIALGVGKELVLTLILRDAFSRGNGIPEAPVEALDNAVGLGLEWPRQPVLDGVLAAKRGRTGACRLACARALSSVRRRSDR